MNGKISGSEAGRGSLPNVLAALDKGCRVCPFLSTDKAADGAVHPYQDIMSSQEAWYPLQAWSDFPLPLPGPHQLQSHRPHGQAAVKEGGRPLGKEPRLGFQFSSYCLCALPRVYPLPFLHTHTASGRDGTRDGTVSAFSAQASYINAEVSGH